MMQTTGTQPYVPQATPSASAVNIQIFQPQAYSNGQQPASPNSVYQYPTQSIYSQPSVNPYQQYMPQQQVYSPQAVYPQYAPQQQPITAPIEQPMPTPVLEENPGQIQQSFTPQAIPEQQQQNTSDINIVQPQEQSQNTVNVDSLVQGLNSTDNKTQEDAINQIASLGQGDPAMQSAVMTEPIMTGLAKIIGQDTSNLQGPSDAQIAAINKAASGEQLTPEEETLAKELAPKTAADKNRVISMFTLAMLQKNQRDEIERYNQVQDTANQLPPIQVDKLIGFDEIKNAINNSDDKEVKLAAIQALSYVANPQDQQVLQPIFQQAAVDNEPIIQQAANEALAKIGAAPAETPAEPAAQNTTLSKKEQKAAEKAAKKAAKEAAKNPASVAAQAA